MKTALITIMFALLLISLVAADSCSVQDLCYNEQHMPFCAPNDATCHYLSFTLENNKCVPTVETDSDNDGWTDSCDAFPHNETEWMDLDADNVGHNSDCDDLNESITLCEEFEDEPEPEEEPEEEVKTTTTTPKKRSGRSSGNVGPIIIIKQTPENVTQPQEPENASEESPTTIVPKEEPSKKEPITTTQKEKTPINSITGNVIGTTQTNNLWKGGILLFILILIATWIVLVSRK